MTSCRLSLLDHGVWIVGVILLLCLICYSKNYVYGKDKNTTTTISNNKLLFYFYYNIYIFFNVHY